MNNNEINLSSLSSYTAAASSLAVIISDTPIVSIAGGTLSEITTTTTSTRTTPTPITLEQTQTTTKQQQQQTQQHYHQEQQQQQQQQQQTQSETATITQKLVQTATENKTTTTTTITTNAANQIIKSVAIDTTNAAIKATTQAGNIQPADIAAQTYNEFNKLQNIANTIATATTNKTVAIVKCKTDLSKQKSMSLNVQNTATLNIECSSNTPNKMGSKVTAETAEAAGETSGNSNSNSNNTNKPSTIGTNNSTSTTNNSSSGSNSDTNSNNNNDSSSSNSSSGSNIRKPTIVAFDNTNNNNNNNNNGGNNVNVNASNDSNNTKSRNSNTIFGTSNDADSSFSSSSSNNSTITVISNKIAIPKDNNNCNNKTKNNATNITLSSPTEEAAATATAAAAAAATSTATPSPIINTTNNNKNNQLIQSIKQTAGAETVNVTTACATDIAATSSSNETANSSANTTSTTGATPKQTIIVSSIATTTTVTMTLPKAATTAATTTSSAQRQTTKGKTQDDLGKKQKKTKADSDAWEDQQVSELTDLKLEKLLQEAYLYRNPNDKKDKSELFLQMLKKVEHEDEEAFSLRAITSRRPRNSSSLFNTSSSHSHHNSSNNSSSSNSQHYHHHQQQTSHHQSGHHSGTHQQHSYHHQHHHHRQKQGGSLQDLSEAVRLSDTQIVCDYNTNTSSTSNTGAGGGGSSGTNNSGNQRQRRYQQQQQQNNSSIGPTLIRTAGNSVTANTGNNIASSVGNTNNSNKKKNSTVSFRQREGGSLPNNVNVINHYPPNSLYNSSNDRNDLTSKLMNELRSVAAASAAVDAVTAGDSNSNAAGDNANSACGSNVTATVATSVSGVLTAATLAVTEVGQNDDNGNNVKEQQQPNRNLKSKDLNEFKTTMRTLENHEPKMRGKGTNVQSSDWIAHWDSGLPNWAKDNRNEKIELTGKSTMLVEDTVRFPALEKSPQKQNLESGYFPFDDNYTSCKSVLSGGAAVNTVTSSTGSVEDDSVRGVDALTGGVLPRQNKFRTVATMAMPSKTNSTPTLDARQFDENGNSLSDAYSSGNGSAASNSSSSNSISHSLNATSSRASASGSNSGVGTVGGSLAAANASLSALVAAASAAPVVNSILSTHNVTSSNAVSSTTPPTTYAGTSQSQAKAKTKKKSQQERNTKDVDVESVAGYRGNEPVHVLVKYIENTESSTDTTKNGSKMNDNNNKNKKERKKEKEKHKMKKSNSLEELRSCSKMDVVELKRTAATTESNVMMRNNKSNKSGGGSGGGSGNTTKSNSVSVADLNENKSVIGGGGVTSSDNNSNIKSPSSSTGCSARNKGERRSWGIEELEYLGERSQQQQQQTTADVSAVMTTDDKTKDSKEKEKNVKHKQQTAQQSQQQQRDASKSSNADISTAKDATKDVLDLSNQLLLSAMSDIGALNAVLSETAEFHVVTKKKKPKKQRAATMDDATAVAAAAANLQRMQHFAKSTGSNMMHRGRCYGSTSHPSDYYGSNSNQHYATYQGYGNNNSNNNNNNNNNYNSSASGNYHTTTQNQPNAATNVNAVANSANNNANASGNNRGTGSGTGNDKSRRKSTSSMPPSEKSDSSDLDSVHSLPVQTAKRKGKQQQRFNAKNSPTTTSSAGNAGVVSTVPPTPKTSSSSNNITARSSNANGSPAPISYADIARNKKESPHINATAVNAANVASDKWPVIEEPNNIIHTNINSNSNTVAHSSNELHAANVAVSLITVAPANVGNETHPNSSAAANTGRTKFKSKTKQDFPELIATSSNNTTNAADVMLNPKTSISYSQSLTASVPVNQQVGAVVTTRPTDISTESTNINSSTVTSSKATIDHGSHSIQQQILPPPLQQHHRQQQQQQLQQQQQMLQKSKSVEHESYSYNSNNMDQQYPALEKTVKRHSANNVSTVAVTAAVAATTATTMPANISMHFNFAAAAKQQIILHNNNMDGTSVVAVKQPATSIGGTPMAGTTITTTSTNLNNNGNTNSNTMNKKTKDNKNLGTTITSICVSPNLVLSTTSNTTSSTVNTGTQTSASILSGYIGIEFGTTTVRKMKKEKQQFKIEYDFNPTSVSNTATLLAPSGPQTVAVSTSTMVPQKICAATQTVGTIEVISSGTNTDRRLSAPAAGGSFNRYMKHGNASANNNSNSVGGFYADQQLTSATANNGNYRTGRPAISSSSLTLGVNRPAVIILNDNRQMQGTPLTNNEIIFGDFNEDELSLFEDGGSAAGKKNSEKQQTKTKSSNTTNNSNGNKQVTNANGGEVGGNKSQFVTSPPIATFSTTQSQFNDSGTSSDAAVNTSLQQVDVDMSLISYVAADAQSSPNASYVNSGGTSSNIAGSNSNINSSNSGSTSNNPNQSTDSGIYTTQNSQHSTSSGNGGGGGGVNTNSQNATINSGNIPIKYEFPATDPSSVQNETNNKQNLMTKFLNKTNSSGSLKTNNSGGNNPTNSSSITNTSCGSSSNNTTNMINANNSSSSNSSSNNSSMNALPPHQLETCDNIEMVIIAAARAAAEQKQQQQHNVQASNTNTTTSSLTTTAATTTATTTETTVIATIDSQQHQQPQSQQNSRSQSRSSSSDSNAAAAIATPATATAANSVPIDNLELSSSSIGDGMPMFTPSPLTETGNQQKYPQQQQHYQHPTHSQQQLHNIPTSSRYALGGIALQTSPTSTLTGNTINIKRNYLQNITNTQTAGAVAGATRNNTDSIVEYISSTWDAICTSSLTTIYTDKFDQNKDPDEHKK